MTDSGTDQRGQNPQQQLSASDFDAAPAKWLPTLMAVLDEQAQLCAVLDTLSQRQSEAVAHEDTDVLLRVLGERQVVIDRVTRVNAALEPFRSRKDAVLGRLSAQEREGVAQRVSEISRLVESVQRRDDGDRTALERQRGRVADELSTLSRSRGAVAAYAAGNAVRSYEGQQG